LISLLFADEQRETVQQFFNLTVAIYC